MWFVVNEYYSETTTTQISVGHHTSTASTMPTSLKLLSTIFTWFPLHTLFHAQLESLTTPYTTCVHPSMYGSYVALSRISSHIPMGRPFQSSNATINFVYELSEGQRSTDYHTYTFISFSSCVLLQQDTSLIRIPH